MSFTRCENCSRLFGSLSAKPTGACAGISGFVRKCVAHVATPSPLAQRAHQVVQLCPGVFARNGKAKVTARGTARISDKSGQDVPANERPFQHMCFAVMTRNERNNRTGCPFLEKPRFPQCSLQ